MLKKITVFLITLLICSCAAEEDVMTHVDSFDIDIAKGIDLIDKMEVNVTPEQAHDIDIIHDGSRYTNSLRTTDIESFLTYSLSDCASNIAITFDAANKTDHTEELVMDVHFIDSRRGLRKTRKIRKQIGPGSAVIFRCKYR
ncbi:MAG: hypothetical protein K6A82_04900 [Prevotella sp.]|nr:hypothetical protein [Prevotella sp.]